MAAAEDYDPLFADLVTGPGCRIVKTECRALSLTQFQKIIDHITRRLTENEEIWQVDSYETGVKSQVDLTDPLAVNLYHTCQQVIIPGTIKQQLSLVELMAEGDQIGDYFTSHWWGEPIIEMFSSLTQAARDKGMQIKGSKDYLDGRVPCFWICAYANNQHKLDEEIGTGKSLAQTSFCLAMNLARGTISVVDANGVSWSRIWCVYELYVSVVKRREGYTYDLYTALKHTATNSSTGDDEERLAVGVTEGLVHLDGGSAYEKSQREEHFPLELIDRGVGFKCAEGAASVEADKVNILAEIGELTDALDDKIHSVVAAGALERVLKENGERLDRYLEAVRKGSPPQQLDVDLGGSKGDT